MNHEFFQNIFNFNIHSSEPQETNEDRIYLYNTNVLEISTNWRSVKKLMNKYKNGKLVNVDPLERDWFNFIIQNNIDLDSFEDNSDFIKKIFKIIK